MNDPSFGWIRMRAILMRHPKVVAMAHYLESDDSFRQWASPGHKGPLPVTFSVTLRVTVASLFAFWCDANVTAVASRLPSCDRHACDVMAGGVPGFGAALESVGWIRFDPHTGDAHLPNFQEHNVEERQRSTSAERTRRWRQRHRAERDANAAKSSRNGDASPSVTKASPVTTIEEKRREEKNRGAHSARSAHNDPRENKGAGEKSKARDGAERAPPLHANDLADASTAVAALVERGVKRDVAARLADAVTPERLADALNHVRTPPRNPTAAYSALLLEHSQPHELTSNGTLRQVTARARSRNRKTRKPT